MKRLKRFLRGDSNGANLELLAISNRLKDIEKKVVGETIEEGLANGTFKGKQKRHLTGLVQKVDALREACGDEAA